MKAFPEEPEEVSVEIKKALLQVPAQVLANKGAERRKKRTTETARNLRSKTEDLSLKRKKTKHKIPSTKRLKREGKLKKIQSTQAPSTK
jgi:hypothetical protein